MTVAPITPSVHPIKQGVDGFFTAGKAILNSTDGLSRVSELCLAIFAAIAHFAKSIPDSLSRLGDAMNVFLDLTSIVSIIKRCKDWFVADEGKMIWQKAWHQICSLVCLTGAHLISFVKFLSTTLKAFSLGRVLAPLSLAFNGLIGGFGIFEMITNSIKCHNANKSLPIAIEKQKMWMTFANPNATEYFEYFAQIKIDYWQWKVNENPSDATKLAVAQRMLTQWTEAKKYSRTESAIFSFCNKKVEQLQIVIDNHKVDRTKAIVSLVYDVALVILMAISLVMAFFNPLALVVSGLIMSLIYSGSDVTEFMIDTFLNKKPVPAVTIPEKEIAILV